MSTKLLSSSWGRSIGAMFQRRLAQPLIFGYPLAAPKLFHTFFCPPLRIAAYRVRAAHDDGLEKVFDRVVLPWRFVRIPKALFVVEVNPGDDLPEEAVKSLCETGQTPAAGGGSKTWACARGWHLLCQGVVDAAWTAHEPGGDG